MSLIMTGFLKVPMQFFILATGVFLFIFYQFERPPIYFNSAEIARVEQSPARDELLRRQAEFDQAFDRQRELSYGLVEARRRGDAAEAERLLAEREAAVTRLGEIRKTTADLIRSTSGTPTNDINYVYPSFLLKYFSGGILGMMISVIFAAAMSSIAGEIAALSSASMVNFYKRYFKPEASDAHYLRAGQISTIFWGIFATVAAFLLGSRGTSLVETVNTVGSHFYGPILGVFILAFFVKRATGTGAFISIILGMIAVISVSWFTKVSWLYLNVIGPLVVVTAGIIFSLIFPGRPKIEGEIKNSE